MKTLEPSEKRFLGTHDFDGVDYLKKDAKPYTVISLFTGCGGAALGIRKAGFEIRVMVEWDKQACATLRANWTKKGLDEDHDGYKIINEERKKAGKRIIRPSWYQKREPTILQADITQLKTEEILTAGSLRVGEATLLEGGFPCQGFSMANNKRDAKNIANDDRNFLYLECVRVIREALPKQFFLENVPGLVSMEKGRVIRMICSDLANSGYTVNWDILNAADYGVPQNRKRVFIIGNRNDVLVMPDRKCNPQLHIGGAVGTIKHPDWFEKKYTTTTQGSLFDNLKK